MNLPAAFTKRMKQMLGAEYDAFMSSYFVPRTYGMRVNTRRISPEEFGKRAPFDLERIPWIENGFFYKDEVRPSAHPWYQAGVYYLQEPSAMTPANRLPVEPGERVLDLCAAPGGKSTELAAKLKGEGLLVANDISLPRTRALLRNLELFGTENMFVLNEKPEKLAGSFPCFFDKILVDAPCSGEGMFRKNEEAAQDWSEEKSAACAATQRSILESAYKMLRPGGLLMYSTCTFAPAENEQSVSYLLEKHEDMKLIPIAPYEGFSAGVPEWGNGDPSLALCVRIWPHKMPGEGHFMALMKKSEESRKNLCTFVPNTKVSQTIASDRRSGIDRKSRKKDVDFGRKADRDQRKLIEAFQEETGMDLPADQLVFQNEKVYWKTDLPDSAAGLQFIRNGMFLGECRKGRFEPSQPLALAAFGKSDPGETHGIFGIHEISHINLFSGDQRIDQYLRGETIITDDDSGKNGWKIVCVDGFPLGWGKKNNSILKNKYLCSWRKK